MRILKPASVVFAVALIASSVVAAQAFAGTTSYKYDANGRVVEVDYPSGTVVKYTYDKAGNRSQVVVTP